MDNPTGLGRRVLALRDNLGLSQDELAARAGLVRCACGTYRHCWTVFRDGYVDRQGHRRRPTRYYRCAHAAQAKSCPVGLVNADRLETWVKEQLKCWHVDAARLADLERVTQEQAATQQAERAAVRAELEARLTRFRARLSQSYDNLMDGVVDRATYRAKVAEYQAVIRQAEDQLRDLREPRERQARRDDLALAIARVPNLLDQFTAAELAATVRQLVERIEVVERETWRLVARAEYAELLT